MGIVRENAKIRDIETEFPRRKEKFIHGEKKLGVQKNQKKNQGAHILVPKTCETIKARVHARL